MSDQKATDAPVDPSQNTYAAIDLGSNSFHMAVARMTKNHLRLIDRLRESVRLGSGLDEHKAIKPATMIRALNCLEQFQQRLRDVPKSQIRAVGTNTLRRATNSAEFCQRAEAILGVPIDIIAGREEARLIYTGVTFGQSEEKQRLIVDIGGGSTELIIGSGEQPTVVESVNIGCVSSMQAFFAQGVNNKAMERAIAHARLEVRSLSKHYQRVGWEETIGTSGTIKAIERLLIELELAEQDITRDNLKTLTQMVCKEQVLSECKSISEERKQVLPGGLSVLRAVFDSLGIERMRISHAALREGVIVDLMGRPLHENVQCDAVADLQRRFRVDTEHAQKIETTALALFDQLHGAWDLDPRLDRLMLSWACRTHEVGLSVSHSQYHKHGEYLLRYCDLFGFTRKEQYALAALVRNHRRKIKLPLAEPLDVARQRTYPKLLALLRLSVLMHRDRASSPRPKLYLSARNNGVTLIIDNTWLEANPLTYTDLLNERQMLERVGVDLQLQPAQVASPSE